MSEHKNIKRGAEGATALAMTFGGKVISEIELRDHIIRHSLQLQRLSAGQEAEAEAILRELERELKLLLQSQTLSDATKAQIMELVKQAESAITPAYDSLATVSDTHSLAVIVAEKTVAAMGEVIPATVAAPTAERLASLTKDVLIDGAPSSAWWERQSEDLAFRFAAEVRQGVVNGETNEQIVRRIVGGKNEVGIMQTARNNARALVHSSVMTAANTARLASFRKNADVISSVRWLATLDSHTCAQCAALDGSTWDLDGKKTGDTKATFQSPPAHFSCRCVLSAVPKTFAELGVDLPEPKEGTRASSEGPVPATTTFQDFLKRQSPAFIDKTLGKKRAELFMAGKITLRDLISGSGRELSLAELESHI